MEGAFTDLGLSETVRYARSNTETVTGKGKGVVHLKFMTEPKMGFAVKQMLSNARCS